MKLYLKKQPLLNILFIIIFLGFYNVTAQENEKIYNQFNVSQHINEVVLFVGNVVQVLQPYQKGNPTFLNIGNKYPNQAVSIVIWGKDYNKKLIFFKKFEGHLIQVKGKVYLYKGKLNIKVIDVNDIKIYQSQN